MLDIKFLRNEPETIKENIRKKFQEDKLPLVDEVIALDREFRESKTRCDYLRSQRNSISKEIGRQGPGQHHGGGACRVGSQRGQAHR